MSPKGAIDARDEYSCGSASWVELKVSNSLNEAEGVDREVAAFALDHRITA